MMSLLVFLMSVQAFAETHGAEHGIPGDVKWQAANIIVFIGILVYFGGAKIKKMFSERNETYHRIARETEKARKDLENQKADLIRRAKALHETSSQSLAQAKADAEKAMQEQVGRAKDEATRIVSEAQSQLKSDSAKLVEKLRMEAVEMSMAAATSKLESLSAGEVTKLNATIPKRVEGATL
ncbi:MAG: ATP synthase F0 subunit B [Bdellovibrionaceae bacterium]|nr:ATP synthase F0 subunit B [Pseudobdellovibrionaceae bacterium]